jgi:hypothetical protein
VHDQPFYLVSKPHPSYPRPLLPPPTVDLCLELGSHAVHPEASCQLEEGELEGYGASVAPSFRGDRARNDRSCV